MGQRDLRLCAVPFSVQNGAMFKHRTLRGWRILRLNLAHRVVIKVYLALSILTSFSLISEIQPFPRSLSISAHGCLTINHISQPPLQLDESCDYAVANGMAEGILTEASGSPPSKAKLLIFPIVPSRSPFELELGHRVAGPAFPKMRQHCRLAEQEWGPRETSWSKVTDATTNSVL